MRDRVNACVFMCVCPDFVCLLVRCVPFEGLQHSARLLQVVARHLVQRLLVQVLDQLPG